MFQTVGSTLHCINPDCPRPYPQDPHHRFCNSCGTPLKLQERYLPLQRLGSGGFAAVYTVWDEKAFKEKVLKVLLQTSSKARELFEQEARVLASLDHPGIPQVEVGNYFELTLKHPADRILCCLAMEKIEGETLQDILNRSPQGCEEVQVRQWLLQALEILQLLHQRQIVHRDLKPSNLMIRRETGQLVAIDFGGAKQMGAFPLSASTRLISPGYSPPEQAMGGAVTEKADIYALGRTMIHLLTGQPPNELEDPRSGLLRWRHLTPVRQDFANLLDKMVQPAASQRPDVGEIAAQLRGTVMITRPIQLSAQVAKMGRQVGGGAWTIAKGGSQLSWNTVRLLFRVSGELVKATAITTWEVILGTLGATVGTATGFVLAASGGGQMILRTLETLLSQAVTNTTIPIGAMLLIFAMAGWGTAQGLAQAGGFQQKKRRLKAGMMGLLGYSLGWLMTATLPAGNLTRLILWLAIGQGTMILGLRLPSHPIVHSFVTVGGTSFCAIVLLRLFYQPLVLAPLFGLANSLSWEVLPLSLIFFGLVGLSSALGLAVSYYVVVPFLKLLGWR